MKEFVPQFNYDKKADVMYISFGEPCPSETVEVEYDILFRYKIDKKGLSGITILNFSRQYYEK